MFSMSLIRILLHIASGSAAFRPRAHATIVYDPLVEKGRPVLQGLLAIDFLAKEVAFSASIPTFYFSASKNYHIFTLDMLFLRFLSGHWQFPSMPMSSLSM